MMRYQKPLVALVLLSLGVQSYADVLQTSVGASHTTPKVINQTQNSATSESLEINPYGKLSDVNQTQAETIGIDFDQNPFIYGSGYHDSESNLEYMGARYYSADIGRFMAQDSYDLINRYNYANANPIMYVDPDGHFPQALNYIINGVGLLGGILGAIYSGGSSMALYSGIIGAISGLGGVGSQIASDTGNDPTVWNQVSFYAGAASLVFDGWSAFVGSRIRPRKQALESLLSHEINVKKDIQLSVRDFCMADLERYFTDRNADKQLFNLNDHGTYPIVIKQDSSKGLFISIIRLSESNVDSVEKALLEIPNMNGITMYEHFKLVRQHLPGESYREYYRAILDIANMIEIYS